VPMTASLSVPSVRSMQGDQAVALREHCIRLEASLTPIEDAASATDDADSDADSESPAYSELSWTVVDIDSWLNGNRPWADEIPQNME
jgi:hypothetical protein